MLENEGGRNNLHQLHNMVVEIMPSITRTHVQDMQLYS